MSRQLGIRMQWETPLPIEKNWGFGRYLSDQEIPIPNGYWLEGFLPISHDGCALFFM